MVRLKLTQAARKHRLGAARIAYVFANVEPTLDTRPSGGREFSWIGPDDRGLELEIVGGAGGPGIRCDAAHHPRYAYGTEEEVTMKINLGSGTGADIASIENIDLDQEVVYFEGERLTEARAEAIARDIAARHGRKGGRPPLAEETSRLGLRLPSDLRERLQAAATKAGVSESELAREAIDDYLAKGA
ncbi:MAG TPA: hypothetical protein DEH05_16480 [Propionibacteriaceae bacterium]|nr:hypothetical protein [Propionibacteriaceae bacterium]